MRSVRGCALPRLQHAPAFAARSALPQLVVDAARNAPALFRRPRTRTARRSVRRRKRREQRALPSRYEIPLPAVNFTCRPSLVLPPFPSPLPPRLDPAACSDGCRPFVPGRAAAGVAASDGQRRSMPPRLLAACSDAKRCGAMWSDAERCGAIGAMRTDVERCEAMRAMRSRHNSQRLAVKRSPG